MGHIYPGLLNSPIVSIQWTLKEMWFQKLCRLLFICAKFHIIFISQLSPKHRPNSYKTAFVLPLCFLSLGHIKWTMSFLLFLSKPQFFNTKSSSFPFFFLCFAYPNVKYSNLCKTWIWRSWTMDRVAPFSSPPTHSLPLPPSRVGKPTSSVLRKLNGK